MTVAFDNPRSPIMIDRVFEDPDRIFGLVRSNGPYWPTMRYVANQSELDALGSKAQKMEVAPWFRGDWAYEKPLVPGAEEILANPAFAEAALEWRHGLHATAWLTLRGEVAVPLDEDPYAPGGVYPRLTFGGGFGW